MVVRLKLREGVSFSLIHNMAFAYSPLFNAPCIQAVAFPPYIGVFLVIWVRHKPAYFVQQ